MAAKKKSAAARPSTVGPSPQRVDETPRVDEAAPTSPSTPEPALRTSLAWWGVTCALVLVTLGSTVRGEWLWDDEALVASPRLMRGLEGLARIWVGDGTPNYFPLTSTSFWLERRITDQPWLPRLNNLVLHAIGACLVGTLATRLRVRHGPFVGILFAVHPLVVSSAAWVAERKNTLSLCLGVASLIVALPAGRMWPTRRELAASVGLFALALLAKTQVVGLPIVLAGCWWLRGRPPREAWIAIAAMLACAIGLGLVTIAFQDAHAPPDAGDVMTRGVRAADATAFQLAHTVWPSALAMIYPRDAVSGQSARGWVASLVLVVALAGLAWASTTRQRASWARPALVILVSYLALLAPTLGLLDMSFMRFAYVADHFGYAALPVALVAFVLSTSFMPARASLALLTIVATALCAASFDHSRSFLTRATLWAHNVEVAPRAAAAQGNLALALQEQGHTRRALRAAREAVRLAPEDAEMHCFLGVVLLQQMQVPEARRELEIALALDPELARAHNNLASALVVERQVDDGIAHVRAALAIEPDYALGHMNLARLLASRGEMEEAEREQAIAIELDPSMHDVPLLPPEG